MPSLKPFTYQEFTAIYSKVPRLSVDVVVKNKNGIALTLRSITPFKDHWHIPGSTVLYGESATQTAHRVGWHELGVRIQKPKLLGYIEYNEEPHRGFGRSLSIVFLAELKSGKIKPDEDATNAQFFSKLPAKIISTQKKFLAKHMPEIISGKS